jgi:hypothetical protein
VGEHKNDGVTILVDRPRCCVSPGVVVEGCEIKLAYQLEKKRKRND